MSKSLPTSTPPSFFADHARSLGQQRYVYAVVSRRAQGVSIGVNLNQDRLCNFRCVYCQVDRSEVCRSAAPTDFAQLAAELDATIGLVQSGRLFEQPRFAAVPESLQRLADIALSGDGEPTAHADFEQVVELLAEARRRHGLDGAKIVLLTNASLLHVDRVRRGLAILDRNHGEIWAKLDAGTEAYYRRISRSRVPWLQILENIRTAAQARPIVIQSLFMRIDGEPPPDEELDAYARQLCEITAAGGRIRMVQIHTIARAAAERFVAPLTDVEVDELAERIRQQTALPVTGYPTLPPNS
jgi:wyosine [tRNA(Phe)-imidazoG37] synthetase (radical SAM superfamily)